MTPPRHPELRRASLRLAIRFAVLILVLFAVLGGVVYAIVSSSLAQATQRTLVDSSRVDSPRDAPSGTFVTILGPDGSPITSPNLPPGLPDRAALTSVAASSRPVQETRTIGGHNYLIRTSKENGRVTQVVVDLHEGQEELNRLGWALAITAGIAAIAAALIAALMAGRAMRPLADALALQRRFVMDASHELRTPLTLLSTRAQLVRRRLSRMPQPEAGAEVAEGLDEIVQDSRVLSEILEDLLIAADPRDTAEKASLDLAALADEAVSSLRPEAETRQLRLERTGSSGVMVTASRVSIQRLFTALIANSLDHATTTVSVEVSSRGREAVIRVVDDGPGFPEGMDERAFERFASSRPGSQEQDRPRHYGLGLALVADVAARHGGGVSVGTAPSGSGAAVTVRLPTHA